MPELAEVEVVRRNLERWWQGRAANDVVLQDPKLLEATDPEVLVETLLAPLVRMERRGKYLIGHFANGSAVVFHFRMTGKIVRADMPDLRFARLAWQVPQTGWLVFKDQRRLGHVRCFAPGALADYRPLVQMGPEPFELDAATLARRLQPGRLLKAALMDQCVVAGVGNIAISELFWRTGIAPKARAKDLSDKKIAELAQAMPRYFEDVIAASQADEIIYVEEGAKDSPFEVYGHRGEGCRRCGTPIAMEVVAGRSSYYCPACQSPEALAQEKGLELK